MSHAHASRRPDPSYFREMLRIWFIYHLMRHPKIDEIARQLRPAWDRALAVSYDAPSLRTAHFTTLPRWEPALVAYIAALEAAVLNELRCTEGGIAAPWVCHALHGLIAEHQSVPFAYPGKGPPQYFGELRLSVMAAGGAGLAIFVDRQHVGEVERVGILHIDPPSDLEESSLLPAGLDAFNEWDDLRDAAHRQLDRLIDEIRGRVDAVTEDWPRYYRKGSESLIREKLPRVVAYLVDREPLFGSDRTSIYPALKQLNLDKPADVKKLALKRPKHSYTRSRKRR